uniref:Uncharacterized protein n=1 Tax=Candidatus Kentrum sp. LPFa TaxID=2126335 RepID=A0A450VMT0_9GAMM|nr:MAG: hypothetical protein BECKLPF1236A_GA0070988_1000134 [Candidatus Kentron sp. LPFa]VFK22609.1 MAG: hypothetical protein BECKLPF1236C_GA0070990_1000117 [Candidatus Kentron sp. LPFa]
MNIFRFSRGDFYGTIIPGSFFAINIFMFLMILLYGNEGIEKIFGYLMGKETGMGVVPFFVFFVASYVLGSLLRSIPPDISEKIYVFFSPKRYKIVKCFPYVRFRSKDLYDNDKYPYGRWFRKSYLLRQPKSYCDFYRSVLINEFGGIIKPFKGDYFINLCKVVSFGKSDSLRDEIIFCEGLVRFYSGTFLALLLSVIFTVTIIVVSIFFIDQFSIDIIGNTCGFLL